MNRSSLSAIALSMALGFVPGMASAKMNYSFIEGGYVNTEIDTGPSDVDGDGIGIAGSWGFAEQFHAFGSYTTQDFDFGIDLDLLRLGAGFNIELSPMIDFVATAAYVDASIDGGGDENGYELGAGVRSQLGERFQLDGGVAYTDYGSSDDTSLRIDARYFVMETLALGAGAEFGDDVTTWKVGVRWEFAN